MSTLEKKKAIERKQNRENGPVRATLSNLNMSARKIRVIADAIRAKSVSYSLEFLAAQKKACSVPLKKLIESAVANADSKGLDIDTLNVSKILVNKGPLRKRFMPRAQGRATKIRKQSAHIEIFLES